MNPRQRRGVLIMLAAALAAVALFFVAIQYIGSVNSQVAPKITVFRAAEDLSAYAVIEEDDLESVEVPEKWVSEQATRNPEDVVGRRVAFNLAQGTYIGDDMILPTSALNENEREIALTVDAKTGVAGRVRAGDFVDVYAVFGEDAGTGTSRVLVRNVRVVSVRGAETRTQTTDRDELTEQQVIPVTLALEPTAALSVTYADSFAQVVRLVGLPPGTNTSNRSEERETVDADDLDIPKGEN
ncbi:Flp pilus assembly protein CpaB [Aeromicrobium sp. 50.2.37]|uniref:Flp pilus assembly protein CpaB n=1 Tax=Aeromicrobium sp. 50.2.37 TaxID=2969305 RepID=UPI00214FF904|nr:Flp pilus assembly protein CpaB [Aeromicrobium sp. 50.2.37]MCR4513549.1 Flp pilus assembly protein CpaB [Aeromicrobium sp. 50.2.37]